MCSLKVFSQGILIQGLGTLCILSYITRSSMNVTKPSYGLATDREMPPDGIITLEMKGKNQSLSSLRFLSSLRTFCNGSNFETEVPSTSLISEGLITNV